MTERTFFETELLKITEAYCVEHNIPISRRFTHDELAPYIQQVREARAMQERVKGEA